MHHYDAVGRVVCMRNNVVERVGVVRSMLPSDHGPWWELRVGHLSRRDASSQFLLVMPVAGMEPSSQGQQAWRGEAEEPVGRVRIALVSEGREAPRSFPRTPESVSAEWWRMSRESGVDEAFPWGDQQWAEAAAAASVDDTVAMFLDGPSDDSSEDEEQLKRWLPGGDKRCKGCLDDEEESEDQGGAVDGCPSVEALLARLDFEEAEAWAADPRPSARVAAGGALPTIEELLGQLSAEEERDRRLDEESGGDPGATSSASIAAPRPQGNSLR